MNYASGIFIYFKSFVGFFKGEIGTALYSE